MSARVGLFLSRQALTQDPSSWREALSAMADAGLEIFVSASFGVTISDLSDRSPDVFVRVADEALYKAKAGGRNRVESLLLPDSELGSAA